MECSSLTFTYISRRKDKATECKVSKMQSAKSLLSDQKQSLEGRSSGDLNKTSQSTDNLDFALARCWCNECQQFNAGEAPRQSSHQEPAEPSSCPGRTPWHTALLCCPRGAGECSHSWWQRGSSQHCADKPSTSHQPRCWNPCAWPRASVWPSPSWFTAWLCLAPEGSRSGFRQWRPRAAQPDLEALWKAPVTLPQILTWWNRDKSTLWGSTETKPKPFCCEIILLTCCFFAPCVLPTSSHTLSTTSSSVASASCKSYPGSPISFTLCKPQLSEMSVGQWGLESGKRGYKQTTRKIHLAVHKRQ